MTNVDPGTAPAVQTVGFISPPGWVDPSPAEFPTVCADRVQVQQCPLSLPGFDWRLDSIARTEPELLAAARALGDMGCDLVANVGTPFAWAGQASVDEARARQGRLADAAGVPVVMSGIAIIDACTALGADRVGLASTYYSEDWTSRWARYVQASGVDVVAAQNLAGQGLMPQHDDAADRAYWAPTAEQIAESVRRIAAAAPEAEAIAISGAGTRTLTLIHALEAETGRPVFGSDTALYWAGAKTAGVELKAGILGRLTDAQVSGIAG
jgi:maleate isomerase